MKNYFAVVLIFWLFTLAFGSTNCLTKWNNGHQADYSCKSFKMEYCGHIQFDMTFLKPDGGLILQEVPSSKFPFSHNYNIDFITAPGNTGLTGLSNEAFHNSFNLS